MNNEEKRIINLKNNFYKDIINDMHLYTNILDIGIDIVKNDRLKNKDDHFIRKILTEKEFDIYINKKNPQKKIEFLCGRVAIKEAIYKCLNLNSLDFNELEILNKDNGKPYIVYNNLNFKLSISHEKDYTIGIALLII